MILDEQKMCWKKNVGLPTRLTSPTSLAEAHLKSPDSNCKWLRLFAKAMKNMMSWINVTITEQRAANESHHGDGDGERGKMRDTAIAALP